jgi:aspartate dehydrogenase
VISGERTLGLIGCGGIGGPLVRQLARGELPGWKLSAVLARSPRTIGATATGLNVTDDADEFFANVCDLVIEAAGPPALAEHGARALAQSDVWTVSGTALLDTELRSTLETTGASNGHRLRVISGAIGGLDAVSTLASGYDASVHVTIDLVPAGDTTHTVFEGTVAQAATRHPNHLNVAVATALAGLDVHHTSATVRQPAANEPHTLTIDAASADGKLTATTVPVVDPANGKHIVAAALASALRKEVAVIWAG